MRRPIASLLAVPFAAVALGLIVSAAGAAPTQAGGGCHGPDGSAYTEGPATVIRMDVCSFSPTVVRVPVGTTVRFLNTAPVDHVVTGRSQTWSSATLRPGAEFSEAFRAAGVYPFSCPLHAGMVGAVIVGDAAQAAPGTAEEAGAAPTSASVPTSEQAGSASIVPAALAGVAGGGVVGILVGGWIARRRPASTRVDQPRGATVEG